MAFSDAQIQKEEYKRVKRQVRTAKQEPTAAYPNKTKPWQLKLAAEIKDAEEGIQEYLGDPVWGPFFVERYQILRRAAGRHVDEYKNKLAWHRKQQSEDRYGPQGAEVVLSILRDEAWQLANLTRPEKEVRALWQRGLSQPEIAKKLKKTQQSISKTTLSMNEKFGRALRQLVGTHTRVEARLTHYADTHGLTDWGLNYIKQHGENPPFCRNCESLYRREQELKVN